MLHIIIYINVFFLYGHHNPLFPRLWFSHRRPTQDGVKRPAKRESSSTAPKTSKNTEEPPSKKPKEDKVPEGEKEDVVGEEEVKMEEGSSEVSGEATQAAAEPPALGTDEAKESPDNQKTAVSVLS